MNFLLISLGSRGDINPFISLALALKKRGHNATIITSEVYEKLITDLGLSFISCGSAEEYYEVIRHPDLYDPKKVFFLFEKIVLGSMPLLYRILAGFDPKDTTLVATSLMLGARMAHEKYEFPLITVCLQPQVFWSAEKPSVFPTGSSALQRLPFFLRKIFCVLIDRYLVDRTLSPQVNQFRSTLGLPKIHHILSRWSYSPQKIIGCFPDWFAQPAADWPANLELTGFVHYDENPDELLAPEILNFLAAGEAPLVFTYGTFVTQGDHFFKTSIEAARKLGRRCLILTQHPEQLPSLNAKNEMLVSYVPLKKLLPHAAAIVHHGGIGTISQALVAALPQLIVPMSYDQPDNAFRLEKLGVSLTIPPKKYSLDRAARTLQKLLDSREIKSQCLHYSKKINFHQAEQQLCKAIEKLSEEKFQ
ncbi:MAG: glycosyltransferase [Verrucomicrobiae bacterium]|nr:glycosyltransferase [Verrucomicrobiae bacterium]